ncbi:hypothetical protein FHW79_002625 [Azospirillum sp. OGB3]|nr:hypothetical protein [Azospirillum sp. OGB3]
MGPALTMRARVLEAAGQEPQRDDPPASSSALANAASS